MPRGAQEFPRSQLEEIFCFYVVFFFTSEESYPFHKYLVTLFSSLKLNFFFFSQSFEVCLEKGFLSLPLNILKLSPCNTLFYIVRYYFTLGRLIVRGVAFSSDHCHYESLLTVLSLFLNIF